MTDAPPMLANLKDVPLEVFQDAIAKAKGQLYAYQNLLNIGLYDSTEPITDPRAALVWETFTKTTDLLEFWMLVGILIERNRKDG